MKTIDDFIKELQLISEEKRKLPLVIECPNGQLNFVLTVNGVFKKYVLRGKKSNDSRIYFFEGIWTDEFTKDFKSASKCSIRVNQDYCNDDYYIFNFSGSTAAYNFIII